MGSRGGYCCSANADSCESRQCGHRSGELRVVDCTPTYHHPTARNSVRANESVDHANDGCGDHFRNPHRQTACVCTVISEVQIEVFICPAALRLMSTVELVIAQAINHFNGNTSSHVKRQEVLIRRRYRLLLLDHEIDSCGDKNNFRIPQRQTPRLCSLNR